MCCVYQPCLGAMPHPVPFATSMSEQTETLLVLFWAVHDYVSRLFLAWFLDWSAMD